MARVDPASTAIFQRGVLLLAAVGIYFAIVHLLPRRLRCAWPKEVAVAVLFALGASLAAWGHVRTAADFETIFLFSCLCWINCAAITQWEQKRMVWPIGAAAMCVAVAAVVLLYQHRPVLSGAERPALWHLSCSIADETACLATL